MDLRDAELLGKMALELNGGNLVVGRQMIELLNRTFPGFNWELSEDILTGRRSVEIKPAGNSGEPEA